MATAPHTVSPYEAARSVYLYHMNICKDCVQCTTTACWPENCHWYRAVDALCPEAKKMLRAIEDTIK